ncbi:MAG: AbrB/MazE/SpoVT family DNA-binding domain-containing protein, partial [Candidatus Poribacteria bacterium]|nr:AbrB/MazE/SpoVT family DNA-binding domain-containing protein [Candidatus Poribacteria bacterium]
MVIENDPDATNRLTIYQKCFILKNTPIIENHPKRSKNMAIAKILEHGQITIPKPIRESLGLKKGDVVDARIEGDSVVITPQKLVTSEDWEKLLQVMNNVHEQNRGISEEEVYQDVERAVAELRQEEYDKQKKTA